MKFRWCGGAPRQTVSVCVWGNGFCITSEHGVSQGARGQLSYKRLMFALYIAAAHTGMLETAFLPSEEMVFLQDSLTSRQRRGL